jgi:hypothetical protein
MLHSKKNFHHQEELSPHLQEELLPSRESCTSKMNFLTLKRPTPVVSNIFIASDQPTFDNFFAARGEGENAIKYSHSKKLTYSAIKTYPNG